MANGDRTLLNLISQPVINEAKATGNLLQALWRASPLAIGGKAIGQAAATATTPIPEGQHAGQFMMQQRQQFGQQILKDILEPIQNAAQKEAEKIAKERVRQQVDSGTPLAEVQAQIAMPSLMEQQQQRDATAATQEQFMQGLQTGEVRDPFQTPEQQQTSIALAGGQPNVAPAQDERFSDLPPVPSRGDLQKMAGVPLPKQGLLSGFGFVDPVLRQGLLQNSQLLQEITGQTPLAKGEKEKIALEGLIDLEKQAAKTGIERQDKFWETYDKGLTSETNKQLSLLDTALTSADDIIDILGIGLDDNGYVTVKNAGMLKDPNFFNKNRRALTKARDIFVNKLLRRDSGAAITPDEMKQASQMFGFQLGNIKALAQNAEVIGKVILQTKDQLTMDRNRLVPNLATKDLVFQLEQKGYTRSQIYTALTNRGMIN